MRIIMAPAKTMKDDIRTVGHLDTPVFIKYTEDIMNAMKKLSFEEAKQLWKCNDETTEKNMVRFSRMDLHNAIAPAILSYDGIAFKYLSPSEMSESERAYISEHLRILSGLYGVLKPMDGITPYRLEMQSKVKVNACKDLYEFWGKRIYDEVRDESRIIINLASKEYSKCIEKYLDNDDMFITCVFGEEKNGKVVQKGVYAKMARGEMVRYMAEKHIDNPLDIKKFNRLGYSFNEELSSENEYVFTM